MVGDVVVGAELDGACPELEAGAELDEAGAEPDEAGAAPDEAGAEPVVVEATFSADSNPGGGSGTCTGGGAAGPAGSRRVSSLQPFVRV